MRQPRSRDALETGLSRARSSRTAVRAFAAALALLLPLPAMAAERDYLLRWIVPPDPDVAGYVVYLASSSMGYGQGMDIGFQQPGPDDVASYLLQGLDAGVDHYVVVTAYDYDDLESDYSNELLIPALACNPGACDDGNPCTADGCAGSVCTNSPVPDGTRCDDGDPGTVQDTCFIGVCSGVPPACSLDSECDDGNPCTADVCDPISGCASSPVANGTGCNDGLFCTVNDRCTAGACGGSAIDCAGFGGQCSVGACDEAADRCVAQPAREGLGCDDGDACSVGETCSSGACGGGSASFSDGYYEIHVDGTDHPILDPSGAHEGVDVLGVLFDLELAVDPKGRVSGTGLAHHALFSGPVPFMAKGRLKGRDGSLAMKLKLKLNAPSVKGVVSVKYAIDVLGGTYTQKAKLKVSAGGEKLKLKEASNPLPLGDFLGGMPEAGWALLMELENGGGQNLEGMAHLALDSGGDFGFQAEGTLKPDSGQARLKFHPPVKGLKLKPVGLHIEPDVVDAEAIQYKVLGQSGTATAWTASAVGICGE